MLLITMIFLHIVDDYYLQGWFANAKQKKYWIELPNYSEKYKFDYIVALIMHAFSWTYMVMLPIAASFDSELNFVFYIFFVLNMVIHAISDDQKANKCSINLVQDQTIHILQIIITFLVFCL